MSKSSIAGIAIAALAVSGVFYYAFDYRSKSAEPGRVEAPIAEKKQSTMEQPNGLKIETLKEGNGEGAKPGHTVTVHYTGTLADGRKFDSSLDRGQPFSFKLGGGMVIRGWDEGLVGMKTGEKRRLTIPPELGYGSRGAGGAIPPNATLVFEVEMLGMK